MSPIGKYPRKIQPIEQRFLAKVEKLDSGCWKWLGGKYANGYGAFYMPYPDGKSRNGLAHRAAYEIFRGKIPPSLVLDHTCKDRLCVNPDHLEPVTQKENLLRGAGVVGEHARATHCVKGHPLSGDNLRMRRGWRECIECTRVQGRKDSKAYAERKKAGIKLPPKPPKPEKKGQPIRPLRDRFEEKYVKDPSGCWLWTGALSPNGYGAFYVSNWKANNAHRVSYELYVGPIPENMVLDHLCGNHACVNPAHLEPVPQIVNILRGRDT